MCNSCTTAHKRQSPFGIALDQLQDLFHDHAVLTAEFDRLGAYLARPTLFPLSEAARLIESLAAQLEAHFQFEESGLLVELLSKLPDQKQHLMELQQQHDVLRISLHSLIGLAHSNSATRDPASVERAFDAAHRLYREHLSTEDALLTRAAQLLGVIPRRTQSLSERLR
jgi:hypothetical protein